jgi:threonine aldolase
MFCLSKGLGAPVGSMLTGSAGFIDRARSVRKMFGGGMRQAGVLAAAGLIALEEMPARLCVDHDNARLLADQLSRIHTLDLDPSRVRTNIVIAGISRTGFDAAGISALLKRKGVLVGTVNSSTIRMLTHLDISRKQVCEAAEAFRAVLAGEDTQ